MLGKERGSEVAGREGGDVGSICVRGGTVAGRYQSGKRNADSVCGLLIINSSSGSTAEPFRQIAVPFLRHRRLVVVVDTAQAKKEFAF